MAFRYGIEFETLLLDKSQRGDESKMVESNIDERLKLLNHISGTACQINILPIDNVCRNTNTENMWIIDEDVTVDIKEDSDIDDEEDVDAMPQDISEDVLKLYHKLFDGYTTMCVTTPGCLITGNEIISPPFSTINEGRQQITAIYAVFSKNNNITSYHNSKTSMHIHYSFNSNPPITPTQVFHIYMAWLYFEPVIMALVPKWRREDNIYCTPIRDLTMKFDMNKPYDIIKNALGLANKLDLEHIITAFQFDYSDSFADEPYPYRHKTLNMINLIQNKWGKKDPIGTIEVRIKHGSCDIDETMNYIQLFGLFMLKAMTHGEDFFTQNCAPDLPYSVKSVLLSNRIDMRVKFKLFKHFLGTTDNQTLLSYFDVVFQRLFLSSRDPRDPLPQAQSAGARKYSRTTESLEYKAKKRIIYVGKRGGQYIKLKNRYVSIKTLNVDHR